MSERRQLPRWQVKRDAEVWLPQMQEFSHCIIEDLNLKGMRVSFNKRLPEDQNLKMSLSFEGKSEYMKLEVNLPWIKEDHGQYVYGMSFNNIMDSDRERVYQYIIRHCSQQLLDKWWAV
jgi:hypothetical protein